LFFSRQIADPQFGARMTGKIGQWTLGTLVIDDRQPGLAYANGPYATRAVDGVLRVTREFGKQSYVGAFASSRDFSGTSNRVASLDARLKFSKNWVANLQGVHSWTRQDSALSYDCLSFAPSSGNLGSQQGNALWGDAGYTGRHLYFSTRYSDLSPNFCTELGFVNRIDLRQNFTSLSYIWQPQNIKIVDYGPTVTETLDWNHAGVLQDWAAVAQFQLELRNQTSFTVNRGERMERFAGIDFRQHGTAVSASTQAYKWISVSARYTGGTGTNYYPAQTLAPFQPFLGSTKRVNFGFTLRPSSRFRIDETWIYSRLGVRPGWTTPPFNPNGNVFSNYLNRTKLNYQFTRELSVRLILDYNATISNPELFDVQTSLGGSDLMNSFKVPTKQFTADVLLTYLLHPGTAFYAGYNNSLSNLSLVQAAGGNPAFVMLNSSPSNTTSRLFFVKVSYLLRY